jgi:hypothetical protein
MRGQRFLKSRSGAREWEELPEMPKLPNIAEISFVQPKLFLVSLFNLDSLAIVNSGNSYLLPFQERLTSRAP